MIILTVPVLLVLLLISSIILLIRKRWKTGIMLLCLSFLLNIYTETFPLNLSYLFNTEKKENSLRILTYNIQYNNTYLKQQTDSLEEMIRFFKEQDADIVVLPESRLNSCCPLLRKKLKQLYPYDITDDYEGNSYYIETFVCSRYPVKNARQLSDYVYIMDVLINEKTLKLVACHLESNQWHSTLNGDKGIISNIKNGFNKRAEQAQIICEALQHTSDAVIVCGDLNDVSGSATLSTLQNRLNLQDAWWQTGLGYGATFNNKGLYLRLDHILCSATLEIESTRVPHTEFSDHYPVITYIRK